MFSKFQEDVVLEITEMHKLSLVKNLEKASTIVWKNEDGIFAEDSGMSVSEAAELAIELA